MDTDVKRVNWILGVVGAAIGGVVGYIAFLWLVRLGIYALALPGAILGLGCSLASQGKSQALGGVCGVAGALVALVAEWHAAPFRADPSLLYFLTHLHEVRGFALAAIAASGLVGYWFGLGREGVGQEPRKPRGGDRSGAITEPDERR